MTLWPGASVATTSHQWIITYIDPLNGRARGVTE